MAKEKEAQKEVDYSSLEFKINPKMFREGYSVIGEDKALRIIRLGYKSNDPNDEFEPGHVYFGKFEVKSRRWAWEDKGAIKSLTGLTKMEVKAFGNAGAIIIPKDQEFLLR